LFVLDVGLRVTAARSFASMVSVHQWGYWPIQKSGGGILPAWRIRVMLRNVVEYRFANWGCRRATLSLTVDALTLTLLFVR
jgi:hypothetical protein